jgi:NAD(P)-dependent dehydrogenase (short-subunit alcohol dehydrogenase family)
MRPGKGTTESGILVDGIGGCKHAVVQREVPGMDLVGQCVVVTGGGHGIGRALAEAFSARGAKVAVADVNRDRAQKIADRVGGEAFCCDVGDPAAVSALVSDAQSAFGPVAVFCSNAGITDIGTDLGSSRDQVQRIVDVNLLAHVWAAQAVLPQMLASGNGYLVQTISSAALITGPSGMGYTLTKHGALGFAEWVHLNYSHRGIGVTCLCPNAVNTGFLGRNEDVEGSAPDPFVVADLGEVVEPEVCAELTLQAMDEGRFLVLPHPRVSESFLRKAQDYDAWLARTSLRLRRMIGEED